MSNSNPLPSHQKPELKSTTTTTPDPETEKAKPFPSSGTDTPSLNSSHSSDIQNDPNISTTSPTSPPTSKWTKLWHWKPPPARYDPSNPPKFTIYLNVLFGFVRCTHLLPALITPTNNYPGIMLHRLKPLLQSSNPKLDLDHLLDPLRAGLLSRDPDAGRLRFGAPVHLSTG